MVLKVLETISNYQQQIKGASAEVFICELI
jgi:hypothetical protein